MAAGDQEAEGLTLVGSADADVVEADAVANAGGAAGVDAVMTTRKWVSGVGEAGRALMGATGLPVAPRHYLRRNECAAVGLPSWDLGSTPRGSGLTNMGDRLDALGAGVDVRSGPGSVTPVVGRVPVLERPA